MERGREFVKEAMETVLIQEFGGLTGVSKTKMLILHITGPNCPDLDMVDLPGLVSTHVRYFNSSSTISLVLTLYVQGRT